MFNNGSKFNFELFGFGFNVNDGIGIRAVKSEQGDIVPFLRVYPKEGKPKDYILKIKRDKDGDLITDPVVFEKLDNQYGDGVRYRNNIQFKVLISGDTVKFAGTYLY